MSSIFAFFEKVTTFDYYFINYHIYTVGHKKGATLFSAVTLAILEQLLRFFIPGN